MNLRDYQERGVAECVRRFSERPLLRIATGGGKTFCAVEIVRRIGLRFAFVAHRREIIRQSAEAFRRGGISAGIVLAGERPDPDAVVQVCSIQTLVRREFPKCDAAIFDEAHHCTADSYARAKEAWPNFMGLTATPARLDGRGLGEFGFGCIVDPTSEAALCASGVLHAPTVYAAPGPKLAGVRTVAGDYERGELGRRMQEAKLVGDIVDHWLRLANNRKTVAFAVTIEHAKTIAARFLERGVPTEVVTGATPKGERDAILARLAAGATTILVNVGVVSEGWDLPSLECVIGARPTKSLVLFRQAVGRAMRACESKDGALLLDHCGWWKQFGLVTDKIEWSLHSKAKRAAGAPPTKACPNCGRVIPIAASRCPGCGVECGGGRDMNPSEADGELVLVSGGRVPTPPYSERAGAFRRMFARAQNIVTFGRKEAVAAGDRGLVDSAASLFGDVAVPDRDAEARRVCHIAASIYRKKYGHEPVALGAVLFDAHAAPGEPGHMNPGVWERFKAMWRAHGDRKGWAPEKTYAYVQDREKAALEGR